MKHTEEVFFNNPLFISADDKHSGSERRYLALGKTNQGRELAVVFTLRQDRTLIRVISARAQRRKERLIMTKSARNVKPIPKFRSEAKEREFWESKDNDATQYFDSSKMVVATFKNLKPSTTSISLRLADSLLDGIRQQAHKMDVPYQSLMKIWLTEKLREQMGREESVSK